MANSDCKPDRSFTEGRKADTSMNQPPQASKRIVSKSKYLKAQGKKASLSSFGVGITLLGLVGLLSVCIITGGLIGRSTVDTFLLLAIFIGIVGGGSSVLVYIGLSSIKEARQIDPGVPLTRANTVHLPAPESLVRASEEPVREQQAVLLRSAAHEPETPSEQLVRPVGELV